MAAASSAYVIVGHSKEGAQKVVIPPGCTVVLKAKPGQITDARGDILTLLCDRTGVFHDPVANAQQIVDRIGSVAIVPAGSSIPDITFTLFTGEKVGSAPDQLRFFPVSGVLPLPEPTERAARPAPCRAASSPMIKAYRSAPPDFLVPDMYDYSVLPTRQEVEEALGTTEAATLGQMLKKELKPFKGVVHLKLSEILEHFTSGGRTGGVFYVVSCRGSCVSIYDTVKTAPRYSYVSTHGTTVPRRNTTASPKTQQTRALLLKTIQEAEVFRKSAIRGSRYNRPTARRSATRRSASRTGIRSRNRA